MENSIFMTAVKATVYFKSEHVAYDLHHPQSSTSYNSRL